MYPSICDIKLLLKISNKSIFFQIHIDYEINFKINTLEFCMDHITEVMCIPSVQLRPGRLDRSHDRYRIGKRTTLVDRLQHQVAAFFPQQLHQ